MFPVLQTSACSPAERSSGDEVGDIRAQSNPVLGVPVLERPPSSAPEFSVELVPSVLS